MTPSTITADDLSGRRFGRLVARSRADDYISPRGIPHVQWHCCCDCGGDIVTKANSLRNGSTKSCGCLQDEVRRATHRTHGQSSTRVYRVWLSMIDRCYRERSNVYRYYGGRGIRVCKRWLQSFGNFATDMGPRPYGHMIERRNPAGDYSPENCRWATRDEQAHNKRNTVTVTVNGETLPLTIAAQRYGVKEWTLRRRLAAGQPLLSADGQQGHRGGSRN